MNMPLRSILTGLLILAVSATLCAQRMSVEGYVQTYHALAVSEMIRSGVPASITLAQGVLETENGNSALVKKSNNHFGIKCKAEWTGEYVRHDDDEDAECFRKYDSAIHSYRDHSDFLRTRAHYAFLFNLDPYDYKAWAHGLKKAGYATNPQYAKILIKTIEDYRLNTYTAEAMRSIPDYTIYRIQPPDSSTTALQRAVVKLEQVIRPPKSGSSLYNGLRAVFADSGTSLLAIATRFDVPLPSLLEYNDLIEDGVLPESGWLYLEKKRTEGLQQTCVVKAGDDVYGLSQLYALQMSYLMAYNGLDEDDELAPGTTLALRSNVITGTLSAAPAKKTNSAEPAAKVRYHVVRNGESIYTIGRKYRVSVTRLKEWNNLSSNRLARGQRIIISK